MTENNPSGAAELMYRSLRSDMLSCRLPPGTALNIRELARQRSLKPAAVREALVRLTAEGLAIGDPRHGFRAAPVSASELRDLTAMPSIAMRDQKTPRPESDR
jgi:DNA-binding GntR family transcriptional regulator